MQGNSYRLNAPPGGIISEDGRRTRVKGLLVMKTLSVFLLLALSASAQPGRAGDRDDPFASRIPTNVYPNAVLATGNPPLTESMVDLYNNLEAWLYELPRTQQQRNSVR